ncbi:MAG: glycine cleavage T C-terminal barrel domain-containing protein, partial [Smithellaceae bacterium]|nr:glycine cleavage T C-terminal barrel domain-containing protein [Smithellaceae bacterium]
MGHIWDRLLEAGAPEGMKPVGLGARDTLRLEAGMMLYGHEAHEDTTPLEVPYGWIVDLTKNFIGVDILRKQKEEGPRRKLVGFEMIDRGIARADYEVYRGEKRIGVVTSGTFSPSLNRAIGMAMVDADAAAPDVVFAIKIRETLARAKVVKLPFYKRDKSSI